jgi:hypothetical protein
MSMMTYQVGVTYDSIDAGECREQLQKIARRLIGRVEHRSDEESDMMLVTTVRAVIGVAGELLENPSISRIVIDRTSGTPIDGQVEASLAAAGAGENGD